MILSSAPMRRWTAAGAAFSASGEWHQLKPPLSGSAGQGRVLDLGLRLRLALQVRGLNRAPAAVLGIDLSEKNDPGSPPEGTPSPAITYRVCGMDAYEYPAEAFDLVISNLALHYVEDLEARIQTGPQDAEAFRHFPVQH